MSGNGLLHVFEKLVRSCKKFIAREGRKLWQRKCQSLRNPQMIMNIKIEDFADTQEEEDRIAKLPLIKSEHKDSINLQEVVPDSYSETSFEASYDNNQVIDIKVEDDGGVKVEEDPVMITFPVIKAEHEVSCVSIVRYVASPFVCPYKQFRSAE
ncbi:uncharacterized protein LOC110838769 isoform X3 [Zootermopsis nevadensis]|uniref:uncharacterized protein LOC110838769 isoform X3 n=1 Tax=Zootermopsis nevadensis TaxID=136037 RepID=UPI000B8E3316|nr:uncharacterized protein LOC110838769 isoform X3 [Zootermopsis nevadensis]